jgi:phage N-6-adenine-methyltransferase
MTQPEQKPFRSKQNYGTPENFLMATKLRLTIDRFAFDYAADSDNAKARRFWTQDDDSLRHSGHDWAMVCEGGWGWLNPPFTTIGQWAKKCREMKAAGGSIAFLVPAAVGANWFRDHVDGYALVLLLNGRLGFMPEKPTWLYPKDCVLCLYSPDIAPGYEVWDWRKHRQEIDAK